MCSLHNTEYHSIVIQQKYLFEKKKNYAKCTLMLPFLIFKQCTIITDSLSVKHYINEYLLIKTRQKVCHLSKKGRNVVAIFKNYYVNIMLINALPNRKRSKGMPRNTKPPV
jgi:hypothetical protein